MSRKQLLVAVLFVVAVLAAFLAGRMGGRGNADPPTSDAEAVHAAPAADADIVLPEAAVSRMGLRYVTVETRTLQRMVQATGQVGPDETRLAHIRAMARGRVDTVFVRLGDRVKEGQRLLSYDNAELGEAIGEYLAALAAVEKAQTEAGVTLRSMERAAELVGRGAIARAEHDRREAEYRSALANIESQKAGAAMIEERLHRFGMSDDEISKIDLRTEYHREASHTTVTAPLAGVITESPMVPGEPVSPDDLLVTVADLSTMWIQADVFEKDIASVHTSTPAVVTVDAYPGRTFAGRITYISDTLDSNTRTAKVRCEVPNPESLLKLDMFAAVRIPAPSGRQAVVIPAEAVQRIGEQPVAFVSLGGGRFRQHALKLGESGDGRIEVLEGLQAGAKVVTEGSFVLKSEAMKAELGHHEE